MKTSCYCFSSYFLTANQLKSIFIANPRSHFTRQNVVLTENLCNQILDSYPDAKTLKKVHGKLLLDRNFLSSPSIVLKLIRAYAGCGDLVSARHLFDEMPEKNIIFFNVMIRSYVTHNKYQDALWVFKSMSSYVTRPDHYTYPCVLKACSSSKNLWVGLQIHASVCKVGLDLNLFVGNGLVSMYGKCDCLVDARKVLDGMCAIDVVSWNSMVAGYAQKGHFDDALKICREMESMKIIPDAGTMASLLPAVTNTSSENVIFVKGMFEKVAKKKILVSWNVMIAVYVNNSMAAEAIDLYLQMEATGIDPDGVTITSILPACGDISALSLGRKIHNYVKRRSFLPNLSVENALIDMYAKCGCLHEAREVFDCMFIKDVVSWTCIISAYGVSGRGQDAVTLFSRMVDDGFTPDSIAFVAVLSSCSHSGMLEAGRHYYNIMTKQYNIAPRIEHYSCMVDLLGRAGKVDEAFSFINEMPVEPNERVLGALLGACRVHSCTDIGLKVADRLFEKVPKQSGYYVLMSNIYAKVGKWKEVSRIRSIMKSKGMQKTPGISNVECKGRVYTFLSGDRSHPQSKQIYEKLDLLLGKMKEEGYVPEKESALHDVEEEDKERHLIFHSEKLAIAFALINTKPTMPIRITKNLRVCGDCHNAIKVISKITERKIIVRDTNRFHTFEKGACSCGDYW